MRQKPKTKSSLFYYWSCSHAAQDKRRAARVPKTAPHGPLSLKAWGVHLDCHILSWSQFLSTSISLYQVLWCLCPIHPYSTLFYSILQFLPPNSWSFAGIIQLSIEVNPFFFPISWCSITPKPSRQRHQLFTSAILSCRIPDSEHLQVVTRSCTLLWSLHLFRFAALTTHIGRLLQSKISTCWIRHFRDLDP